MLSHLVLTFTTTRGAPLELGFIDKKAGDLEEIKLQGHRGSK